jgi:small subunit ribosomal protein S17
MSKKILKGNIISDAMQKNVVVEVATVKKHPMYGKSFTSTKNYKARNLAGAQLGDEVVIQESKPYAKGVTWEVIKAQ